MATSSSGYVATGHRTSVFGPHEKVVKLGAVVVNVNDAGDRCRVNHRLLTTPSGVVVDSLNAACVRAPSAGTRLFAAPT